MTASLMAVVFTFFWMRIWMENSGYAALGLVLFVAPLVLGFIFLALLPSAVMYWEHRRSRDGWSLFLSGMSFAVVGNEVVLFVTGAASFSGC